MTRAGIGVIGLFSPAREFWTSGNLSSLAMIEPARAPATGNHCREMAGKLRELARYTRSPGIRRDLVDLAKRYDRRGDHFDHRAREGNFSCAPPQADLNHAATWLGYRQRIRLIFAAAFSEPVHL
jgi:hypothetical protein